MAICSATAPSRPRLLSKCSLTLGALALLGVAVHKLNGGDVVRRARALKRIKLASLLAIIGGGVGLIATSESSPMDEQEASPLLREPGVIVSAPTVEHEPLPQVVNFRKDVEVVEGPVVETVALTIEQEKPKEILVPAVDPGVRAYRIQFVSNILKNSRLSDCQKRDAIKLQLPLLLTSYDSSTPEETGYTAIAGYYTALASHEEKEAIVRVVGPLVALDKPEEVRKGDPLQKLEPLAKSDVEFAFRSVEAQGPKPTEAEVFIMARIIGQLIVAQREGVVPADKRYFDLYKKFENSVRSLTRDSGRPLEDELNDLVEAIDGYFLPKSFAFHAKSLIENRAWLLKFDQIYDRLKAILIPFSSSQIRGFAFDKELCPQVLAQVEECFKDERWLRDGHRHIDRLFEKPSQLWAGRISVWQQGILPELLDYFPKGAFPAIEGYHLNNYLRKKAS